jgi:ankyrin repeat protein
MAHGSDVNERVGPNTGGLRKKGKRLEASDTPLMVTVKNRQLEAASWLLEHGANAEIWNLQGKTAMMLAIERGLEDMVRILEKAADRSVDDEDEDYCD